MKRLIFIYSNSEFYLNIDNIKCIEYNDDPIKPYHKMEILLTDGYKVDIMDYQQSFNFREMMREINFTKGDVCKAIKCRSFTANSDWCSMIVDDWVRQAMG